MVLTQKHPFGKKRSIGPLYTTKQHLCCRFKGCSRHTQWEGPHLPEKTWFPPDPRLKTGRIHRVVPQHCVAIGYGKWPRREMFHDMSIGWTPNAKEDYIRIRIDSAKKCVFDSKHLCHVLIRNHDGRYVSIGIPFDQHISNIFYHESSATLNALNHSFHMSRRFVSGFCVKLCFDRFALVLHSVPNLK